MVDVWNLIYYNQFEITLCCTFDLEVCIIEGNNE